MCRRFKSAPDHSAHFSTGRTGTCGTRPTEPQRSRCGPTHPKRPSRCRPPHESLCTSNSLSPQSSVLTLARATCPRPKTGISAQRVRNKAWVWTIKAIGLICHPADVWRPLRFAAGLAVYGPDGPVPGAPGLPALFSPIRIPRLD